MLHKEISDWLQEPTTHCNIFKAERIWIRSELPIYLAASIWSLNILLQNVPSRIILHLWTADNKTEVQESKLWFTHEVYAVTMHKNVTVWMLTKQPACLRLCSDNLLHKVYFLPADKKQPRDAHEFLKE